MYESSVQYYVNVAFSFACVFVVHVVPGKLAGITVSAINAYIHTKSWESLGKVDTKCFMWRMFALSNSLFPLNSLIRI